MVGEVAPDARDLAAAVARVGGEAVRAIVFFGSRRTGTPTDPHSGYDFFVAVSDYAPFYEALVRAGAYRRSPGLAASINAVLAPNQVRVRAGERTAKCAVIQLATLVRETGPRRHDHFCAGRLFQPASIVYAADEQARTAADTALAEARRVTLDWARPWLPESFDAEQFCHRALQVSMRHEIRPEPAGRAEALWNAQRVQQVPAFAPVLAEAAARGALREVAPGRFALVRRVGSAERARLWIFFQRSRLRATLRWAKYVVTFDDWLDYIVRKAERHTGQRIELTPRERRWPLVFLWPRVVRYFATKDSRGKR
ncbi:MAG: hypothetical protein NDJ94_01320 [Vicinamibacteria bacterium]|nr:hypothetical protein [Vicinamibacteria bacterium]